MKIDNSIGDGLPELAAYISKIKRKLDRNSTIKEVAIQKELYNILINSIHNGWNPLVSKRLDDFGVICNLMHDSCEYFKSKLKGIQPHLRMSFIKTLTNGWHTSSRMHEATCLPCIFGCNALPSNCLAPIQSSRINITIKDETAHYLSCLISSGIITQAIGPNRLLIMHELILGNDIDDLTGVLACAASYHVYDSLKLGNLPIIQKAVETCMFSLGRAFAISSAKAFLTDFDIMSDGFVLSCGFSGIMRDRSQLGSLASSFCPAASSSHLQGTDSPDT